jgi:hypothetical protein
LFNLRYFFLDGFQTGEEYSKTGCVWLEQNQIAKAIVPTFVTGAPRLSSVPQMNQSAAKINGTFENHNIYYF